MNPRPLTPPRWTSGDDYRLRALAEDGRRASVIAERLKRSPDAVYARAKKLGAALKIVGLGLKVKK
jgi:DNA-binding Lrp family transcriptional regulator